MDIRVDYGDDGLTALDRIQRTVIMMLDGVLGEAIDKGYDRDTELHLEVDQGIPCWLQVRGVRAYEIKLRTMADDGLQVSGVWLGKLRKPGLMARLFGPLKKK